ncbi:2-octaprenyl-6-methoxyphenyl hydroxylase [Oceanisphaera pacifica]|uniref:2-octaprenyl-6-methoxyphenyl hydroxylase n=1 Tax=Oceanisphaera pacifica TaxID=2818389 RepID=A0ABS3NE69_9GAMM|nr:2-octaprenyl-6-methoxyphenyl hydroxylase [Oceanisphaera pacifica]MBO1518840.1 2-octaprenyl-6-methoxyphenyl hydroxylase [Oceanisphaera pacifica]
MTHYDVVINGGGMAGAVLALGLSQLKHSNGLALRIALIEKSRPEHNLHPGFDARSIAIAGHSQYLLQQLGLWPLFAELATPITDIQVSDRGHFGQVNLQATDYNLPALGYVIELNPIGQVLYQQLLQTPAIDLFCPTHIQSWQQAQDAVTITLSDSSEKQGAAGHRQFTTGLLVGADGNHSAISRQLNLPRRQFDYQQSAIIANVQTAQHHQHRAFERFTAQGPVALLPMSQGRSSLVWCVSNARAEQLMALNEDDFLSELQQAFGYRLGRFIRTGTRHCYPLVLDEVPKPWHHRVVLVGNAAHLLHPIAGQGFNLGLRDVAALIEQTRQTLSFARTNAPAPGSSNKPSLNDSACSEQALANIGGYQMLSRYGQARQGDQANLVGITSALALLFSNNDPLLAAGRNMGLNIMAACGALKHTLAWQAMGKR